MSSTLLVTPESTGLLPALVTAKTIYFCVRFPSGYRYYFVFQQDDDFPILIDHVFRAYYPQTIAVSWDTLDGGAGVYLDIESIPGFRPFGDTAVRVHIPEDMYDAVVTALSGPVALARDSQDEIPVLQDGTITVENEVDFVASEILNLFQFLIDATVGKITGGFDPPLLDGTLGRIEFILLSTEEGPQIKLDLSHPFPVPLEDPITVETLIWNEVLFGIVTVPEYEFYYISGADLSMSFIDPKFCFLRQWIPWPSGWAYAIKQFSGV